MLFERDFLRRAFIIVLVLFVASCSGGGCSSGCSQCGTAPLPGGFPKPQTSPNSATVRVTRPGIDFLQENLGLLAEKALGTSAPGGVASFTIPKSSQSLATICTPAAPKSPQCEAHIDLGKAKLRINAVTPNKVRIDGLLPVRISDLPIQMLGFVNAAVVAGDATQAPGGDLCSTAIRGKPNFPFKEFPLTVELPLVTETRIPRNGYTKVDVDKAIIDIAITENDVEICDNTCGGAPFCQNALDFVKGFAFDSLVGGIKNQVKSALTGAFCTKPTPTVTPPCPTGSKPDNADLTKATKCVFDGTQECVPSLLGADGRMDLSKALLRFSPGTVGGLDFVLASAGDMNPAPGETTLPAWTPRKPPVPAQDNNKNGISLTMLGGALPQPQSSCVTKVDSIRPEGIPIPAEMTGDTIPNWKASTGPHLGFSLAGRYLDHALAGAYNSGLLCLGIGTEQVEQLSTGYLSILAPSINTLTFQGRPSAAAISTRPGKPPKAKIGNGTDIKTDPLLLIQLDRFAIDFYVWSQERFVRLLTYTADVTVPVNLQTGKDAKNPNGGILPVLGDIKLANASVTNADLLLDDPNAVGNGVTGLVGGIVGQFLGGGFSPIDLQGALSSFGLGLEIPPGGIRKLTSGSDDFLAIFANLTKAAPTATEEADTRASLVEKIVDPTAMGLATAVRERFPKLRIHAEGIASKPTEQTWWVDDGPHAAWTTEKDIVVDADSMLLQGRHTLHVSSRVVGKMATEDSTPVEIPFVIDTLAPDVDLARSGTSVKLRALDYVSAETALLARKRIEGGEWSEWLPLADLATFDAPEKAAVEVEVKDEEGNVGRVSSPLVRGKADGSLAGAGSGCSCKTAGAGASSTRGPAIGAALLLGLALVSRRRRASR